MRNRSTAVALAILALAASPGQAQDKSPHERGELLYSTFCVACHTTQMHWRAKKIARDLPGLREQVRRWQTNAGQSWDAADIEAVVNHLNRTYYKFPGVTDKS